MPIKKQIFPKVENADENGLLAWSKQIDASLLQEAYSNGVFPWPQREGEILWFSPPERGILEIREYDPSSSFKKWKKKQKHMKFFLNRDFLQVIKNCQMQKRKDQQGTWITDQMLEAYLELHLLGMAHSYEVWDDKEMLGGVYGVLVGNYFSAESMFHKKDNMGKLAFDFLVQDLSRKGMEWLDLQMITPFSESIGAGYISREEFIRKLESLRS